MIGEVKLTIEVKGGNAALVRYPQIELKRILMNCIEKINFAYMEDDSYERHVLRDLNGNRVGFLEIEISPGEGDDDDA